MTRAFALSRCAADAAAWALSSSVAGIGCGSQGGFCDPTTPVDAGRASAPQLLTEHRTNLHPRDRRFRQVLNPWELSTLCWSPYSKRTVDLAFWAFWAFAAIPNKQLMCFQRLERFDSRRLHHLFFNNLRAQYRTIGAYKVRPSQEGHFVLGGSGTFRVWPFMAPSRQLMRPHCAAGTG
jgi:hypothetical protein